MHKKILKDLQGLEVSNIVGVKRVLQKINNDIHYYAKKHRAHELQIVQKTLEYFVSTNRKEVYQNIASAYRHKQIFIEVERMLHFCKAALKNL